MLESFGCDIQKMLMVACDKIDMNMDIIKWLKENENGDKIKTLIAHLSSDWDIYSRCQMEHDGLLNPIWYVKSNNYISQEAEKKLNEREMVQQTVCKNLELRRFKG